MVFCGFYPTVPSEFENLRKSLARVEVMMNAPNDEIDGWLDELEEVAQ